MLLRPSLGTWHLLLMRSHVPSSGPPGRDRYGLSQHHSGQLRVVGVLRSTRPLEGTGRELAVSGWVMSPFGTHHAAVSFRVCLKFFIIKSFFLFLFSNVLLLYQWRVTFCLKTQEVFFKDKTERKWGDTGEGRPEKLGSA